MTMSGKKILCECIDTTILLQEFALSESNIKKGFRVFMNINDTHASLHIGDKIMIEYYKSLPDYMSVNELKKLFSSFSSEVKAKNSTLEESL